MDASSIHRVSSATVSVAGWLIASAVWLNASVAPAHTNPIIVAVTPSLNPIQLQIAQLGHGEIILRQEAFRKLQQLGPAAFDDLYRARRSSDHEIGQSASRLISLIDAQSLYSEASEALVDYESLQFTGRAKAIIQLGRSSEASQWKGLIRIARFELDEVLSRRAAVELITQHVDDDIHPLARFAEEIRRSDRVACQWIRTLVSSQSNPAKFVEIWQPQIDQLAADDKTLANHPHLNCQMFQWYADQLQRRGQLVRMQAICHTLVDHVPDDAGTIIEVFDWLLTRGFYDGCARLAELHDEIFSGNALLLFRLAEMHQRQGETNEGERIASQAQDVTGDDPLLRIQIAVHLQQSGLGHWAERQLSQVCSDSVADWSAKIQASCLLAEYLHRYDRNLEACEIMDIAIGQYSKPRDKGSVQLVETDLNKMRARKHYFQARHDVSEGQYEAARTELIAGVERQPNNVDLLIAMHELPIEDARWHESTSRLVQLALANLQRQINQLQDPGTLESAALAASHRELAILLNRYAWLAAHTNGDLDLAEQYGRRAVEIAPRNGHYHDTLANCLYRRGNFVEAVETQQRAVALQPFSRALKTALSRYRQAVMFAESPADFRLKGR